LEFAFAAAEQATLAKPTLWDLRSLVMEAQARGEGNADDIHKRYLARTRGNDRRQFPTGALWIVRPLAPVNIIINVLALCMVGCLEASTHARHWKSYLLFSVGPENCLRSTPIPPTPLSSKCLCPVWIVLFYDVLCLSVPVSVFVHFCWFVTGMFL
jgi:hypothetical protein